MFHKNEIVKTRNGVVEYKIISFNRQRQKYKVKNLNRNEITEISAYGLRLSERSNIERKVTE